MGKRKCIREVIGMNDVPVMAIGIPLIAFSVPLLFFDASLKNGLLDYLPKFSVSLMYTVTYWLTVRSIIIYFRRRFPEVRQTLKRILYGGLLLIPVYIVINQVLDYVHITIGLVEHEETKLQGVTEWDYNVASIMMILLVSAVYESVWLYARWKESITEQERLRRENIQSELEGLRSQVNPHFLFNSLNTLVYLIPEDPKQAVTFVQKMSKVYRYILEIRGATIIPLSEELEFLNSYLFLVKERFGENLKVEIDVPDVYRNERIIPLSMQMLFENAIKHNIISASRPLVIKVFVEGDKLLVRNNLQRKAQIMPSTQVGLQNIRNRYAFYTNESVEVLETKDYFLVSLPLIGQAVAAV